jgi:hypothetical protein
MAYAASTMSRLGAFLGSLAWTSIVACATEEEPKTPKPAELSPEAQEVLERCSDFAVRLCASAADCCESTTGSFSADACAASFASEVCRPSAQAVGEGVATYNPSAEEPCLMAWVQAHATCTADWEEILSIRRDVWEACKTVRGTYEVGQGCSTSSTCAQPDGPRTARCLPDPTTRAPTCQILELLEEGAACRFPNNDVSVCDTGLYCTTHERDGVGVCAPVVPEGGDCDTSVVENSECGLGSYCGSDDGVCHRATNFGGPSCERGAECVSFVCQMSSSGGTCAEARSTAYDLCLRGTG